jgi:hypothetical protein
VGFWTGSSAAYLQTWTNTSLNFTTGNGVSRMVLNTNGSFTINKSLRIGDRLLSSSTGASNLAPIAYGSVDQNGFVIQSTGNISVTHPAAGQYQLSIASENIAADANKYTIMLTPRSRDNNVFLTNWMSYSISGGFILVNSGTTQVNAQVTVCGCNQSYITSSNPAVPGDCPFDITIYKNN